MLKKNIIKVLMWWVNPRQQRKWGISLSKSTKVCAGKPDGKVSDWGGRGGGGGRVPGGEKAAKGVKNWEGAETAHFVKKKIKR